MPTISLDEESTRIEEIFPPRVVAVANGQYVKIARFNGEFVWHSHTDEDELFLVRKGSFTISRRSSDRAVR